MSPLAGSEGETVGAFAACRQIGLQGAVLGNGLGQGDGRLSEIKSGRPGS